MRIISSGKYGKRWKMTGRCSVIHGCGCRFEVSRMEAKNVCRDGNEGNSFRGNANCPECGLGGIVVYHTEKNKRKKNP
jgi:hypothetical protein